MDRPIKISFGEMRSSGVRGLLVYCSDYRCSHYIAISGTQWPDDGRLSYLEPRSFAQLAATERRRAAGLRLGQAGKADERCFTERDRPLGMDFRIPYFVTR